MEKFIKNCITSLATIGKIGYFPAPGTCGSLFALPFIYNFSLLASIVQIRNLIWLVCFSWYVIAIALNSFDTSDPSEIVWDEVVGCFFTFVAIPFSWSALMTGFLLFRLFDITKPFGIKYVEKLPGASGVLLDDIVAGLFANIILRYLFL